jgi:antitoxin VapB
MSIKNLEVERLAEELSRATHTSKTEVIRQALREKQERMQLAGEGDRTARIHSYLETRVWPHLKKGASRRWTKAEEDRFLGYGKHGEPE